MFAQTKDVFGEYLKNIIRKKLEIHIVFTNRIGSYFSVKAEKILFPHETHHKDFLAKFQRTYLALCEI